ncbi:glycosyltransferase family 2 protein, partial [Campylobacter helveticus]
MSVKVSVIIPSLNSINYYDECIKSVINQSLKEIEIICVDANSTDGT